MNANFSKLATGATFLHGTSVRRKTGENSSIRLYCADRWDIADPSIPRIERLDGYHLFQSNED